MKHTLSIVLIALFLSACQSKSAKNENSNVPSTTITPLSPSESSTIIPTHNPAHGQPYHDCSLAVGAPLPVKEKTLTPKEVKLNPEHGLPGHRCDLAVGAPLT